MFEYLLDCFEDLEIFLCVFVIDYYGCIEVDFEVGLFFLVIVVFVVIFVVFWLVWYSGCYLIDGGVVNLLFFDGLWVYCDIIVVVDVVGKLVVCINLVDISMLDFLFGLF